ncbi:hypothetical protein KSF78_0002046 [Schistosoma japonicum]|nr:hypothetical protein KSF78_0002046 [Schistosoma japonicum]
MKRTNQLEPRKRLELPRKNSKKSRLTKNKTSVHELLILEAIRRRACTVSSNSVSSFFRRRAMRARKVGTQKQKLNTNLNSNFERIVNEPIVIIP